jgi:peptidoglycan hydrolase-like protein with peptidoglycan-binding domain
MAAVSFSELFFLNANPTNWRRIMFKKIFLTMSVLLVLTGGLYAQGGTTGTTTTTDAAKPKRPPIFRPNKDQIMQVQKILIDKKLYTGTADGKYNDDTRAGIKSFQKDSGLKVTGTLNRATLEKFGVELTDKQKLIPVTASSTTPETEKKPKTTTKTGTSSTSSTTSTASTDAPKKPAPFRANADQIKAAQKILKDGKMYSGEATGKLDDATRDGLKKYQEANGVKVTGTLNAATLEKMAIALTDAQKANVAAQAAYDAAKMKN